MFKRNLTESSSVTPHIIHIHVCKTLKAQQIKAQNQVLQLLLYDIVNRPSIKSNQYEV